MKNVLILLSLVILIALGAGQAVGQFVWTKDSHNPVLSGGGTGAWDEHACLPWVIFNSDSGRYEMWYSGYPASAGIGFAISDDGISWIRDPDPVLTPTLHGWDSLGAIAACVIRDNGVLKMWYTGVNGPAPGGIGVGAAQIGYATSTDGRHWSKHAGNPVLSAGSSAWEAGGVAYCSVMKSTGGYQMFYTGSSAAGLAVIGRATSGDGITWQKDTVNNPVLNVGPPGAWDQNLYLPSVTDVAGKYYMWYNAEATLGDGNGKIGLAMSIDSGKTWTRHGTAPLLLKGSPGTWDATWIEGGSVLLRNGTFHMWYDGGSPLTSNLACVGHATSPAVGFLHRVPQDYATIQAAIEASADGDTVLVAEGIYYENINFKGKAIIVASTFLATGDTSRICRTIIDGSKPTNADSASVVSFISGEDTSSVLCGFTITGGTGTRSMVEGWGAVQEGGGVLCRESGARLTRNIITGNTLQDGLLPLVGAFGAGVSATCLTTSTETPIIMEDNFVAENTVTTQGAAAGGGISLWYMNGILVRNEISDNSAVSQSTSEWSSGGGIGCLGGNLSFEGNLIARNKALAPNLSGPSWTPHGGGVAVNAANLDFRRNRVIDNVLQSTSSKEVWGGGMHVYAADTTELRHVVISGNYFGGNKALGGAYTSGGGIDFWNETPRIENNIIEKNTALYGGGIGIHATITSPLPPSVVVNNTVYDNNADRGGGISIRGLATAVLFNNIFWADSAATNPELSGGYNAYVRHCDVQGGWPADTTNFDEDPQFLNDSLHIGIMSPCWETGTDTVSYKGILYQAPTTSYYPWIPRPYPLGSPLDIGAVEGPYFDPLPGGITIITPPSTFVLEQNYPNPFNPSTVIGYRLRSAADVRLVVYDLLGREVGVLVDERKQLGSYEVTFDAAGLSSGIYFYRLTAGSYMQCRKMILVR